LVPLTGATGSGLWPTPTVCGNYNRKGASKTSGDGLETTVKRWPTPCSRDDHGPRTGHTNGGQDLPSEAGGRLNPTWVEWLMGFPLGWTLVDDGPASVALGMASSPSKPRSRS